MKSVTVVAAVLAAVLLVAVIAGAVAVPDVPVLVADAASVRYPEVVTLTTTAGPVPVPATFKMHIIDGSGWVEVGTVPTTPIDPLRYSFIVRPKRTASYTVTVGGIESDDVRVSVYVPMGTPVTRGVMRRGTTARVYGTIRPIHPSAGAITLEFERYDARRRRWVSQLTTAAAAIAPISADITCDTSRWTYDLAVTRTMAGLWRVRSAHRCAGHEQSYSAWKRFSVL